MVVLVGVAQHIGIRPDGRKELIEGVLEGQDLVLLGQAQVTRLDGLLAGLVCHLGKVEL